MAPFYADKDLLIAGINTVRIAAVKDGRLNSRQVRTTCGQLCRGGDDAVRVVVTHHPIDMPADDLRHTLLARSTMAMKEFARCRVDLFLSGHLHTGQTVVTSARYRVPGYSAVVAHAATAVSTRTRGEANGWNRIEVDAKRICVQQIVWSGKRFEKGRAEQYRRGDEGWELTD